MKCVTILHFESTHKSAISRFRNSTMRILWFAFCGFAFRDSHFVIRIFLWFAFRDSRFVIRNSQFAIRILKFTIRNAQRKVHNSQFTIHKINRNSFALCRTSNNSSNCCLWSLNLAKCSWSSLCISSYSSAMRWASDSLLSIGLPLPPTLAPKPELLCILICDDCMCRWLWLWLACDCDCEWECECRNWVNVSVSPIGAWMYLQHKFRQSKAWQSNRQNYPPTTPIQFNAANNKFVFG